MNQEMQTLITWQCEQFLRRATLLLDRADWTSYIDCFCEDAVLARPSDPERPLVGRDAILASLRERPPRLTCHLLANTVFDVISDGEVLAQSRVLLMSGDETTERPAPAHSTLLAGTFRDRLRLVDNEWRFAERCGSIELKLEPTP